MDERRHLPIFGEKIMDVTNPYKHIIESICNDVLPNVVALHKSGKLGCLLGKGYFIDLIERKVIEAQKAALHLAPEEREIYSKMIDNAYTKSYDSVYSETPVEITSTRTPPSHKDT